MTVKRRSKVGIPASSRLRRRAVGRRPGGRSPLDALAQPIEGVAESGGVVFPRGHARILRKIVALAREQTGAGRDSARSTRSGRAQGIRLLFAGPAGTGKTLAAGVLAGALRLNLYRVDLAAVVSKYVGETEKNLDKIFDAAARGGAVLYFDEADALFGKRGEVKDSHDRYANIEVNYLLRRLEEYPGVAIVAIKRHGDIAPAFRRRFRFVARFPLSAAADRA